MPLIATKSRKAIYHKDQGEGHKVIDPGAI